MSDVTTIAASQPDAAEQWEQALEHFISSEHFGSHIVSAQVIAAAGMFPYLLINGDTWRISANPETAARAEVALTLPMLNEHVAPIYIDLWIESAGNPANSMFSLCWKDSPAERACELELRRALRDRIEDFRGAAAEIAAEESRHNTEKLIA